MKQFSTASINAGFEG